jgi:anti-repressor protein
MNTIQNFNFSNQSIRVIMVNGNPWWCAKDVAEALGCTWCGTSSIKHVPDQWTGVYSVPTPSGIQEMICLSEQGLYFFLGRSDKPKALPFQMWISGDIIPQIRKTGSYGMQQLSRMEILQLALKAEEELQLANLKLLEQQPKVELAERAIIANNLQTIAQVAKEFGTGQKRLFALLRDKSILMKNNVPYQPYLDRGYFEVKIKPITMGDQSFTHAQTFVTKKVNVYLNVIHLVLKIQFVKKETVNPCY